MEKVLRTTYRKLWKLSSRADRDPAMRSVLACAPQLIYSQSSGKWMRVDVGKLASWTEHRAFIDALIRRLNNGRQFFLPPTSYERGVVEVEFHARSLRSAAANAAVAAAAAGSDSSESATSPTAFSANTSAKKDGSTGSSSSSATQASAATIPMEVLPYASLQQTVRFLFEANMFSMIQMNNAFAAVKELGYASDVCDKSKRTGVGLHPRIKELSAPHLTRSLELQPMTHIGVGMFNSMTERFRSSLLRGSGDDELDEDIAESADSKSKQALSSDTSDSGKAGGESDAPLNAFDSSSSKATDTAAPPSSEGGDTTATTASEEEDSVATVKLIHGNNVQLLLAHPQLGGFFRHAVLLLVRNTPNEAIALVLNNPLLSDEGRKMQVGATIRLNRVHPIFQEYLTNHTVMIGGPVMPTRDFEVYLLHRVPDVPKAFPICDGLWLHGDPDVLLEKLRSKEASPQDIIVFCGFAGWGVGQLKGEVDSGTWLIANASSHESKAQEYIMNVCRIAGASSQSLDVVLGGDGSVSDATLTPAPAGGDPTASPTASAAGKDSTGKPTEAPVVTSRRKLRLLEAGRRPTAAWAWTYELLGEPYTAMAQNQKPEGGEFNQKK